MSITTLGNIKEEANAFILSMATGIDVIGLGSTMKWLDYFSLGTVTGTGWL